MTSYFNSTLLFIQTWMVHRHNQNLKKKKEYTCIIVKLEIPNLFTLEFKINYLYIRFKFRSIIFKNQLIKVIKTSFKKVI